jgi:hypothetical protein
VLVLGKERVSARSGGRVRMWRAVGIVLAARPERVTGLRSVTAKRVFGGCARQKLPSHPDLTGCGKTILAGKNFDGSYV